MTAIDLITRALRTIGVYGSGETPSAEDAQDSLAALNEMIDSWSANRLYLYQIVTNEFSAVVGKSVYSVGVGGDFNMTRPTALTGANYFIDPIDYQMRETTNKAFADIPYKAALGIPEIFNYEPSFPLGSLSLWPTPGVAGTIKIQSPQQLTQFPDLTTDVAFPPGYQKAIRMVLCVALCNEFNVPLSAQLSASANGAIKRIRRMNVSVPLLDLHASAGNSRNILTGFN
jgi:hypothetical protein